MSTTPHDEGWVTGEGILSGALYTKDGTWIGSFTNPERARLAAQAPKLVQVLLDDSGIGTWAGPDKAHWHTVECWRERAWTDFSVHCTDGCAAIRAALKDAGVIV